MSEYNFDFFDSLIKSEEKYDIKRLDVNSHIPQFKVLEDNPLFQDLFIVSDDNINIYRETLIRRIKNRESWNKNPKQIIQEIASIKPTIKKLLNQLVEDNEEDIFKRLISMRDIIKYENYVFLISQMFNKILNEQKFIQSVIRLFELLNKEFVKKFKIRNFCKIFKDMIIKFIQEELKDCKDKMKIDNFGLFLKYYLLSNIEKPSLRLKVISKLTNEFNLNVFIILFAILIEQKEIVKETLYLADKTEEIKKKVNVKDDKIIKIFIEFDYDNIFTDIMKKIKDNEELYIGINKFKYLEFKDNFKEYF